MSPSPTAPLLPRRHVTTSSRWRKGFVRGLIAIGLLLPAVAIAGCGGGNAALKSGADDAVRGTILEVKSVTQTGDNAGTAVAEGPNGEKVEIQLKMLKDTGEFVFDRCLDTIGTPHDCRYLNLP